MSQPLSPAAQAVMVAATMGNPNVVNDPIYRQCIAAALAAVLAQVVPAAQLGLMHPVARARTEIIRAKILAIAAELEGCDA